MTRHEALLKLLAVEPETRSRLIVVTGWPAEETEATLDSLLGTGKVAYRNGSHGTKGERRYYTKPAARANAGVLPKAARADGPAVRNRRGGLVREERAMDLERAWRSDSQGSGEAA